MPMLVELPTGPYGTTIFCEEIREEVGGKLIFIGVYQSELIFHGPFPQKVARLAACASYTEPLSMPPAPIKFCVDLIEGEISDDAKATSIFQIEFDSRPSEPSLQDAKVATLNLVAGLPPFTVKAPSLLRLYVVREERGLQIGALKISSAIAPLQGNEEEMPAELRPGRAEF